MNANQAARRAALGAACAALRDDLRGVVEFTDLSIELGTAPALVRIRFAWDAHDGATAALGLHPTVPVVLSVPISDGGQIVGAVVLEHRHRTSFGAGALGDADRVVRRHARSLRAAYEAVYSSALGQEPHEVAS